MAYNAASNVLRDFEGIFYGLSFKDLIDFKYHITFEFSRQKWPKGVF